MSDRSSTAEAGTVYLVSKEGTLASADFDTGPGSWKVPSGFVGTAERVFGPVVLKNKPSNFEGCREYTDLSIRSRTHGLVYTIRRQGFHCFYVSKSIFISAANLLGFRHERISYPNGLVYKEKETESDSVLER